MSPTSSELTLSLLWCVDRDMDPVRQEDLIDDAESALLTSSSEVIEEVRRRFFESSLPPSVDFRHIPEAGKLHDFFEEVKKHHRIPA